MSDEPTAPLNLIERMAKRIAAEKEQATPPAAPGSFIERVARRIDQGNSSSAGQTLNRAEDPIGSDQRGATPLPTIAAGQELKGDKIGLVVANSSTVVEKQGAIGTRPAKQVHLDFRALRQNGIITPDNMTSKLSNEFRGVKRKLLQKVRDPKTRKAVNNLIMVTSSLPNEGKTFSSINLALSLASERGLHVLLIDADVVRPSVGNVFIAPPKEGLVELLSGKAHHVSDVLHRCVEVPNLAIIFAGNPSSSSPELISSAKMHSLCDELSARYPDRVIVIDTPPVLASPEPASLAGYVHQLIMVVAAGQTDQYQLTKSLDAISSCPNINLLFNKAPDWNEAEYTSYYGYAAAAGTPPPDSTSTPSS